MEVVQSYCGSRNVLKSLNNCRGSLLLVDSCFIAVDGKNDCILSSHHRNMSPKALRSVYSCRNWALGYSWY